MLRWVTIKKFSEMSGYTASGVRSKIKRGDWFEVQVWIKAPDGRILSDVVGYERWATRKETAVERTERNKGS